MTMQATQSYTFGTLNGAQTQVPVAFRFFATSDLEVYLNGVPTTGYTVAGAGNPSGGTVNLLLVHPSGTVVFVRRVTARTQPLDYQANDPFDAESHEAALDRLTAQVQDLLEELSRRPALATASASALRNLLFPAPVPLGVLGWDALGTALTLFASGIQQVTPSATSQLSFVQGVVEVLPSSGAGTALLTAAAFLPAGAIILAVVGYVKTTCGNSNGLTTWQLGDSDIAERWGRGIGRTAASASNVGMHVAYTPLPIPTARDVLLTTEGGGLWDTTGSIILTYSGFTLTPLQTA